MSRPNTRSKGKRHRNDDGDDPVLEIHRKIHLDGEISKSDIDKLYMVTKPVCHGCRVNTKDSPNCFCGLIPQSGGTRKSGLWQKMGDINISLATDPSKNLRSPTDTPAGLTNLGATCYANSILQCLYMNSSFRAGIFSLELDILKQHPVLDQLARLFAQLHSSTMAFIDSAPFIKTLELDNGVQQDSHEFLTLFLSLLERSLSHARVSSARTIIQDLFSGSVSHLTRCSVCGKDSEASSKLEDFYELELNIKGLKNLDESLDDYLGVEELRGENQYFCESCGKRVDATRCIKLCSLPTVLNFQLKRYVFHPKTATRKKITSAFSFPQRLNMGSRLPNSPKSDWVYDLSAILIHKGTAVNSGHYVAHIKDENSGQWWEFDDEHVSKLGFHPFGVSDLTLKEKSIKTKKNHSIVNGSASPTLTQGLDDSDTEMYSSTDAYMLMYNRVTLNGNNMKLGVGHYMEAMNSSLPHLFSDEIQELNASYVSACADYQLKKDRQMAYIVERRDEVKSILSEAPVRTLKEPYFWVSLEWLREWADSITPPCVDNSTILCPHGKVSPSKVMSMKILSEVAWSKLLSKYGGGPSLTHDDYCIDCIKDDAKHSVSANDYRDRRSSLRQLAEAALAGNHLEGRSYYVSRAWLVQWLRRKGSEFPCDADIGPTASLKCPHGGLLPELASGAKRVLVPEELWLLFFESANTVRPGVLSNSEVFPFDSEPCQLCNKELKEVACVEDGLRAAKFQQRLNHEKLIHGKCFPLNPTSKHYLVPSVWLANWRTYVTSTGKNMSTSAEPESLQAAIESLICAKHAKLLERPPDLSYKRGSITQKLSATDGSTLIPENDWNLFCEEWNVPKNKGIEAEIIVAGQMPLVESDNKASATVACDLENTVKPIIRTHPEICEDCIGERESCELIRKLNYCDAEICVYLVRGKEAPRSIIEASVVGGGPDRRISKRSKKTSYGNSIMLKVSSSTTIHQLKLMLWESFGVVKENQKLHKGLAEIDGDSATLADKDIYPGDILWVKDSEIYENRDIADELSEEKSVSERVEEGFRGTRLTSDTVVQAL